MPGFMEREMAPREGPSAQCTDDQPALLISVIHLLSALRVPWKYHVLSLSGVLWGWVGSIPVGISIHRCLGGRFLKSTIILPTAL